MYKYINVNKFIKKKKHLAVSEEKHISQLFKKKKKFFFGHVLCLLGHQVSKNTIPCIHTLYILFLLSFDPFWPQSLNSLIRQ